VPKIQLKFVSSPNLRVIGFNYPPFNLSKSQGKVGIYEEELKLNPLISA